MLTLHTILIVCPLVFLGGIIDGISGGGGLITVPAYMLAGLPPHYAIGTNKISGIIGTSSAAIRFWREGYYRFRDSIPAALGAAVGSYFGATAAMHVSSDGFRIFMLIAVPLTAAYTLFGRPFREEGEQTIDFRDKRTIAAVFLTSIVAGIYDGFYGPASITFIFLLLCAIAKVPVRNSIGISRVAIVGTMSCSLTIFLLNGKAYIPLGLLAGCFSVLGNQIGAKLFKQSGVKIVKPTLLIVLAIFFIKTLTEVL